MSERFFTPQTLAAELELPPSTLAKWRIFGGGPRFAKLGKNVRYDRADVEAWLEASKRRTTSSEAA